MSEIEITTSKLAKLLGMKFRTISDWAEREVLVADVYGENGQGTTRKWGIKGIRRAWLAKKLISNMKIDRWKVAVWLDKIDFSVLTTVTLYHNFVTIHIDLGSMELEIIKALKGIKHG